MQISNFVHFMYLSAIVLAQKVIWIPPLSGALTTDLLSDRHNYTHTHTNTQTETDTLAKYRIGLNNYDIYNYLL